ncbi:MAG: hypothetical protein DRI36_00780 [Caldiserica bacterium]|nr:MAG: hypothetical protein DRI36_00780 [Caldisericota bacterium]
MSLKDFYRRFGIEINSKEAMEKFIVRVDVSIFKPIEKSLIWRPDFIRWLSMKLGERWHQYIGRTIPKNEEYIASDLTLLRISGGKFLRCLHILELIYEYLKIQHNSYAEKKAEDLDRKVQELIAESEVNLGIRWKKGKFYPLGVKYLDRKLIEDVLDWLNNFPNEKKDFENALKAYMEKRYNDVIIECYNCVEGITRKILGNRRVLENNKIDLIKKLNLSQQWCSFLSDFINYANEFKRHASEKRHKADPDEVEAYLYLTGLITRLCIQRG